MGKEYLKLKEKQKLRIFRARTAQLSQDSVKEGFDKLTVILDNNSTHKNKIKSHLHTHLQYFNIPSENCCRLYSYPNLFP